MLFSNQISAFTSLDLHSLRQVADSGITSVEIQLPDERYFAEELREMIAISKLTPIAFRAPSNMGLGTSSFQIEDWKYWIKTVHQATANAKCYMIVHGATVPLGVIFEYLDARPTDFNALHDFKTQYVERMIAQIQEIISITKSLQIEVLVENAPMGGDAYFEPGHSLIHPALRTPRHLLQITEATEAKLCFDTAHARITSNVLTYMHRSRSMFAGATEKEILSTTKNWIDFYQQVKPHVGLIRLSYAISWGDTPETSHIPFTSSVYAELLEFADQADSQVPIVLATGQTQAQLKQMLQALHDLKRS